MLQFEILYIHKNFIEHEFEHLKDENRTGLIPNALN